MRHAKENRDGRLKSSGRDREAREPGPGFHAAIFPRCVRSRHVRRTT